MHRDMKVGLALGVLLVGVVGALFFRREPEKKPVPPALQNGSQIDRHIAERARGPYLTQPEEFVDSHSTASPRNATDSKTATTVTVAKPPVTKLTLDEEAVAPPATEGKSVAATKTAAPPAPLPGHNESWESVDSPKAVAQRNDTGDASARNVAVSDSSAPQRTHVVAAGDTLSGIAGKYLGNTGRYREIYEANRDVLRSPDSLTAGLTLKIPNDPPRGKPGRRTGPSIAGTKNNSTRSVSQPTRDRVPTVQATTANEAPANESTAEAPAASPTPLFTPVRRSPFSVGRSNSRPKVPAAEASATAPESTTDE